MTVRAVLLGLLLGLLIAATTYFNDRVMNQTYLIGHFLPISVFGVAVVLLLVANPLLGLLSARLPLKTGEVGVLVAVALAACAFPGSNWGRYFASISAMPGYHATSKPLWQTHQVMSYLPGGSDLLAPGQVRDWPALVTRVQQAIQTGPADPLAQLYALADEPGQHVWDQAIVGGGRNLAIVPTLTHTINTVLSDPHFSGVSPELSQRAVQKAGRALLVAAAPELVLPPPPGSGAVVGGGALTHEVQDLARGAGTEALLPVGVVPWSAWWPTLRLWGGAVALLGLTAVCLAIIVHPQWSQREMLQYPIAKFVEEASRRTGMSSLPDIARDRLFWIGFGSLVVLHVLNGLHVWVENPLYLPLTLEFGPLRQLFPNASRVALSGLLFQPTIFLSVVAFTFMINRQVAFTLGASHVLFIVLGSLLVSNGIAVEYNKFTPNKMNMLRLGSYIGLAAMILYTGRRYYLNVLLSSAHLLQPLKETPRASLWAARLGLLATAGAVWLLTTSGLSPLLAILLTAMALLIWLVLARVVAETGIFLVSGPFLALGIFPALLGEEALGPTQVILLSMAGAVLLIDPREALMPFVTNALQIGERTGGVRGGKLGPVLAVMAVASLIIATVVTLSLQYEHGVNLGDNYATMRVPSDPFEQAASYSAQLAATGRLTASVAMDDLTRLTRIDPQPQAWSFVILGAALVIGCAAARLRLPWWPLHPVLFIVWGTWAMGQFAFSCLLGWAVRSAVVGAGGVRAYRVTMPLMIGIVAGELTGGLIWMIVGAVYWSITGTPPKIYRIIP